MVLSSLQFQVQTFFCNKNHAILTMIKISHAKSIYIFSIQYNFTLPWIFVL